MDRPFAVMFQRPLGKEVAASPWKPLRDFIIEVSRSTVGNLIVRVGSEQDSTGLAQSAYVVLTPDEARDLYESIEMLLPEVSRGAKRN